MNSTSSVGAAHADTTLSVARVLLVVVFAGVALYDLGHGAYLLASDTPWLAHGDDTIWADLGRRDDLDAAARLGVESLLRRMGAFHVLAGAVTATFLILGWRRPRVLDGMTLIYVLVGGAFAWTDRRYFAGTGYAGVKVVISVVTTVALGAWAFARLRGFWRARASSSGGVAPE